MSCERCGKLISAERLEALPNARTCVPCVIADGDVPMKKGRMAYGHKTAGEIEIMDEGQFKEINRLDPRGYGKGEPHASGRWSDD